MDFLGLGDVALMFFSFAVFLYALIRLRIPSKELFFFILPFAFFVLIHGIYHVFDVLEYEELAELIELSSIVALLSISIQFLRERG